MQPAKSFLPFFPLLCLNKKYKAQQTDTESSEESIAEKAEDLNVENTLAKLRESAVIKELEESGKIKLIGAKYDIDTGKVKYFTDNGDN